MVVFNFLVLRWEELKLGGGAGGGLLLLWECVWNGHVFTSSFEHLLGVAYSPSHLKINPSESLVSMITQQLIFDLCHGNYFVDFTPLLTWHGLTLVILLSSCWYLT